MKKFNFAAMAFVLFFIVNSFANAQGPNGKAFGFGLIIGDPTGVSIKYYTNNENAFDAYIGTSYFGRLRFGADYLWHFDTFNSRVVKMYAGVGLALGVGNGHGIWYKEDRNKFYYWQDESTLGFGARALLGLSITPKRTPLEIFFEICPLMGISPNFGINMDAAIGIRFYP